MTEFTKGPWELGEYGNVTANVNLEIAAPDMYDVTKMIVGKLPLTPNALGGEYCVTLTQEDVDKIISVLAKARGEK